jgi:putative redox protein
MATQALADQLAATIDTVRANLGQPSADTLVTFAADTALVDGYRASVSIREFGLTADEPPSIGGSDAGPTPVELVLAGLGTCQEIVYATYARILGIPIDAVAVRAEGRLDLRGFYGVADVPVGFQDVTFSVDIQSPAPPAEVARLVAAVNTHCPVLDILRQPLSVSGSYRRNGEPLPVADDPGAIVD